MLCARGDLNSCPRLNRHPHQGAETRIKSTVSGVESALAYLPIRANAYSVPHRLPHERRLGKALVRPALLRDFERIARVEELGRGR